MFVSTLEQSLLQRCTFPETNEVVCAVSGGADSIALMLLALAAGKKVTAIHVDHGIRDESHNEFAFVEKVALEFGAKAISKKVDVEAGPNLEARARKARYEVLPPETLTGHTADDQAETVLLNMIRGAGISGLSGIRPTNRPLLKLRRSETEAVCKERSIDPFLDPSNNDAAFRRNRIRKELIPLLNDIAQRDVVDVIARQAEIIRDDDNALNAMATELDVTDARAVASASPVIARRAIRAWLEENGDDEKHPPTYAEVERVLQVARGDAVACEIEGGISIRRSAQRLTLQKTQH